MTAQVYLITHVKSGCYYIGSSKSIARRFAQHRGDLKTGRHGNVVLQEAYNDDPELRFAILANCSTREEAYQIENDYILANAEDPAMCNITVNGNSLSRHPNLDLVLKHKRQAMQQFAKNMSQAQREALSARTSGSNNPMYGRTHTPEVRAQMSVRMRGSVPKNKGVPMTPEQLERHRIAIAKLDRKGSNNSFYGRQHSEEFKKWISEHNKGWISPCRLAVTVDGIDYVSCSEASKVLGVPLPTVTWRIKSKNPKFSQWVYKLEGPETIETTQM